MSRPTQALISSGALQHNLAVVRAHAPQSRIMAVVKADAYGHGAPMVARTLAQAGVDGLAVACLEEALTLRQQQIFLPIFILDGPFAPADLPEISRWRLGVVLHNRRQLQWLLDAPQDFPVDVFVKVDTGMHRLGFAPLELPAVLAHLVHAPGVRLRGLLSHLARADTPEDWYNANQMDGFREAAAHLPQTPGLELSLASSAGILRLPQSHYQWVRPGLMLYGMSPFAAEDGLALGLRPVLQLRSELIAIRDLRPGEWLGYGAGFRADVPTRVGVVAAGYGDGYPRSLGTGTPALVGGRRTRLLGRVSMDMLFVDLTPLPGAQLGDEVVLMGEQGGERVTVEELAALCGTIPYELTCRLQGRVLRVPVP